MIQVASVNRRSGAPPAAPAPTSRGDRSGSSARQSQAADRLFRQVLGTPARVAAREPLRPPRCSHTRVWALRLVAAAAIMCLVGLEPGTGHDLIERASAIDLMELASDFGPLPLQVGPILVSGSGESAIPRLRQQLVSAPPGCGRPVWVDDPGVDVARHVHEVACSPPGDEDALRSRAGPRPALLNLATRSGSRR